MSSNVWDSIPAPESTRLRMEVGETVEGTFGVPRMIANPWDDADPDVLEVTVGDRQIVPHHRLHQTLIDLGVQPGDEVKVERTADLPLGGGRRVATYEVARVEATQGKGKGKGKAAPEGPSW